jgi:hypothetical protein
MYKMILCCIFVFVVSCREYETYSLDHIRGLENCVAIYAPYPINSTVVRCKGSSTTVITNQNKRNAISVIEPTDDNIEIKHIKETNAN